MTDSDVLAVIADPLRQLEPQPHTMTCYPLGYPLRIATNSAAVLEAARVSWSAYRPAFDTPPLTLHLFVQPGGAELPRPPVYRGQGGLMSIVSDRENFLFSDIDGNFAFGWISAAVAESGAWMRHHFLEGVVYATLSARYLAGIHAACVMRRGRGLLLHGPSGAGKSCLSYACVRAGWTYVSDDVCFLRRAFPSSAVLGKPHQMRFLPSAAALFPELRGLPVIADANGEPMITLDPSSLGPITSAVQAPVDAIVFLERLDNGPVSIRPMEPGTALERLVAELPLITPQSYEEQKEALRSLAAGTIVRLQYSALDEAVAMLDHWAAGFEASGC